MGFLNPVLYSNPQIFNDIKNGSNPGCNSEGFTAVDGYVNILHIEWILFGCLDLANELMQLGSHYWVGNSKLSSSSSNQNFNALVVYCPFLHLYLKISKTQFSNLFNFFKVSIFFHGYQEPEQPDSRSSFRPL